MEEANIACAEAEAKRFLTALAAYRQGSTYRTYGADTPRAMTFTDVSPKLSGSLRRASLDLTRALSAMRQS